MPVPGLRSSGEMPRGGILKLPSSDRVRWWVMDLLEVEGGDRLRSHTIGGVKDELWLCTHGLEGPAFVFFVPKS